MKKPVLVKKLTDSGFPTHDKFYKKAHNVANHIEKKFFPKGYEHMKKLEKHLKKHELMGKNLPNGKTEVEEKFKHEKKETGLHEVVENIAIKMAHKEVKQGKKPDFAEIEREILKKVEKSYGKEK